MDVGTVQLPALRGNRTRSPEDLQGSLARIVIGLGLAQRDAEPDPVPTLHYTEATTRLLSLARDAIAVAQFQRDERENLRRRCTELEDQIREMEEGGF